MKAKFLIPLGIFAILVVFLGIGLTRNPRDVPSVLIDKAAPSFVLPDLFDPNQSVSSEAMKGKVWLLNVWGTWCPECWREHPFLVQLKERGVPIVSIDWRDDANDARKFLNDRGNPFLFVGFDEDSKVIVDWGVYGAPETFLIDKKGVIRWKYAGALNEEIWNKDLKPLMDQLEGS